MEDISKDVLARLEELSGRVAALEQELALLKGAHEEGLEVDLTNLNIEDFAVELGDPAEENSDEIPQADEPASQPEPLHDHDFQPLPVSEAEPVPAIGPGSDSEPAQEPESENEPVTTAEEVDLPVPAKEEKQALGEFGLFGEIEPKKKRESRQRNVTAEMMPSMEAWKSDMPGSPVKNIRSGISLNDRVMFKNSLFRSDSALFRDTLDRLNGMDSLAGAVKYLKSTFPEWAWGSEMVYRFMMCVRRKLR